MFYHLFSCHALWRLQDGPKKPNVPPADPPGVPKRFPRAPAASKTIKNHTKTQPHCENIHEKLCNMITSSDSHSPKDHGQKPKVNGPRSEVMVVSAGPRMVCNNTNIIATPLGHRAFWTGISPIPSSWTPPIAHLHRHSQWDKFTHGPFWLFKQNIETIAKSTFVYFTRSMESTHIFKIVCKPKTKSTLSNPDLPQLQGLDSHTLQNRVKTMKHHHISKPYHHSISHVIIRSLDLPRGASRWSEGAQIPPQQSQNHPQRILRFLQSKTIIWKHVWTQIRRQNIIKKPSDFE